MIQLPKVQTQKEFMDTLYDRINPPRIPTEDGSIAGKPTELKTYLIENNSKLLQEFYTEDLQINIDQTGLDHVKILTLTDTKESGGTSQFYLDKTDERFLIFHTFDLAKQVTPIIKRLINSEKIEFDNAWLSSSLLKNISGRTGNEDHGFSVDHTDYFQQEEIENDDEPIKPDTFSRMDISGKQSEKILQLLKQDREIEQIMGYDKITIGRGTKTYGVIDDLDYSGRFRVVKGKSVDDHISLVNMVKNDYSQEVKEIEKFRIYGDSNTKSVEGKPFDFVFDRKVEDWNFFLTRIFNAKSPFRIWGIKSKIGEGFYRVLGVDAHTGHPLDIEVMDNLFRIYLPEGSCGNAITRLFVNLQRFFDSKIHCPQLL